MKRTFAPYRAAVQRAWFEYMLDPSPIRHTTGLSGIASLYPTEAGIAYPRPPDAALKYAPGQLGLTYSWKVPLTEPDSSKIEVSSGRTCARVCIRYAGGIGVAASAAGAASRAGGAERSGSSGKSSMSWRTANATFPKRLVPTAARTALSGSPVTWRTLVPSATTGPGT